MLTINNKQKRTARDDSVLPVKVAKQSTILRAIRADEDLISRAFEIQLQMLEASFLGRPFTVQITLLFRYDSKTFKGDYCNSTGIFQMMPCRFT